MPSSRVKTYHGRFVPPLTTIFHSGLETGAFPDMLEVAFAVPIPKTNNISDVSNDRSINPLYFFFEHMSNCSRSRRLRWRSINDNQLRRFIRVLCLPESVPESVQDCIYLEWARGARCCRSLYTLVKTCFIYFIRPLYKWFVTLRGYNLNCMFR